jgi:hypothetical protein
VSLYRLDGRPRKWESKSLVTINEGRSDADDAAATLGIVPIRAGSVGFALLCVLDRHFDGGRMTMMTYAKNTDVLFMTNKVRMNESLTNL